MAKNWLKLETRSATAEVSGWKEWMKTAAELQPYRELRSAQPDKNQPKAGPTTGQRTEHPNAKT